MQRINWKSFLFTELFEDDARFYWSDVPGVCVCLSGALTSLESRVSVRSNLENPHKLCSRTSDDAINDCFRSLFTTTTTNTAKLRAAHKAELSCDGLHHLETRPLSFVSARFTARLGKAIKSVSNTHAIRLNFCMSRESEETPRNRLIIELLTSCEKQGWRVHECVHGGKANRIIKKLYDKWTMMYGFFPTRI